MGAAVAGLTALATVVILMVVLAMVSGFGSDIVQDTQDDFVTNVAYCGLNATGGTANPLYTGCGAAYNNTVFGNQAIGNLTDKMPTLATVLIGAFIILILVSAFAVFGIARR